MKANFTSFILLFSLLNFSCSKSATDAAATPAENFSAMIDTEKYSDNTAYISPALGGTIAIFSKDAKGRTFTVAIFEKDFPLNKAINIAFSPSISFGNETKETFIAKSGTMTISAYEKSSTGILNKITGTFAFVGTGGKKDVNITAGKFSVSKK